MSRIETRVAKAERAVGIEGRPVIVPGIVLCLPQRFDEAIPRFPEDVSEWVTVQRATAVLGSLAETPGRW